MFVPERVTVPEPVMIRPPPPLIEFPAVTPGRTTVPRVSQSPRGFQQYRLIQWNPMLQGMTHQRNHGPLRQRLPVHQHPRSGLTSYARGSPIAAISARRSSANIASGCRIGSDGAIRSEQKCSTAKIDPTTVPTAAGTAVSAVATSPALASLSPCAAISTSPPVATVTGCNIAWETTPNRYYVWYDHFRRLLRRRPSLHSHPDRRFLLRHPAPLYHRVLPRLLALRCHSTKLA